MFVSQLVCAMQCGSEMAGLLLLCVCRDDTTRIVPKLPKGFDETPEVVVRRILPILADCGLCKW